MNDDALKQLLQQADAAAPPPSMPAGLARRVRRRALRRTRTASGLRVAAALLLAVGLTALLPRGGGGALRSATRAESNLSGAPTQRAELARLEHEADGRRAIARRMQEILKQRQRAAAGRRPAPPIADALAEAQREIDKTAFVLVRQADRMCREMNLCESAAKKYRRVVAFFPDSPWAATARQRLNELNASAGERS